MGGKLWASCAGQEGRHDASRGQGPQGQRSGPSRPGRSHRPARLLHRAADPLWVPSSPLKIPRGSRCGEAGAGAQAGTASSALYLQFRWDPLQRKRLDKEAPSAAQPHPNGTMPSRSPAPQAHHSAAVPPADGEAAKQCACRCPHLPSIPGPRKGLRGPFLAGASPQGEAESVPPSRSPHP